MNKPFLTLGYFGSKVMMLDDVYPYIDDVAIRNDAVGFIDCCGGGGSVSLNLERMDHVFKWHQYNDRDVTLCDFFRQVSTDEGANLLIDSLLELDYSEDMFKEYLSKLKLVTSNQKRFSQLEHAVIAFVTCNASNSSGRKAFDYEGERKFYRRLENIGEAPDYANNMRITNMDFMEILKKHGSNPRIIKYIDPPYVHLTRGKGADKAYQYEMLNEAHIDMVNQLLHCHGFIVSGYNPKCFGSDVYDRLFDYCDKVIDLGEFENRSSHGNLTTINNKHEFLWIKY